MKQFKNSAHKSQGRTWADVQTALIAPTGRAAKVLASQSGGFTLHGQVFRPVILAGKV